MLQKNIQAKKSKVSVFWFRRDLRLNDNTGLLQAMNSGYPVLPLFIFDTSITDSLPKDDARVTFIYDRLESINKELGQKGSSLYCRQGNPESIWKALVEDWDVASVYCNEDYEPSALQRDEAIKKFLSARQIPFFAYKDQVIFARDEVMKNDGKPYTVYTPYKNKWRQVFSTVHLERNREHAAEGFLKFQFPIPSLESLGFRKSLLRVPNFQLDNLACYADERDFPSLNTTSKLSTHLRFGTVSIREIIDRARDHDTFLNELIWREFFMQILYHFPQVTENNFHRKYDGILWRNNEAEFEKWKLGKTGYPMVDAGMRELNATGFMHNRVRMITASFLCKHLLIDWRWGEAYFALKLLDYELASNNGNWQWAAGTGCDAAPYFRVFNPKTQLKKFDPQHAYIRKWIPELNTPDYPKPIVDHKFARERALKTYKEGIEYYSSR